MGLTDFFSNIGVKLFYYFASGAKIAAALELESTSRRPIFNIVKESAKPKIENGYTFYDSNDLTKQWELKVNGKLILQNNSKNYAYNLTLLNADKIFSSIEPIGKLISIAPNDRLTIPISFIKIVVEETGPEADIHLGIPDNIKNSTLQIQYENEAGTKLLTKSLISFEITQNTYTTK